MINIKKLLANGEDRHTDAKGPMSFEGVERIELTKDIIAMANTQDGGDLIIGVSQDPETGVLMYDGLSAQQAQTFDCTKISDFVNQKTAPPVKVHSTVEECEGKLFVVIQVPEFDDQPHICTKEGQDAKGKTIFRKGDIFIRTAAAQSARISDASEMRELLNSALKHRSDTVLRDIARLFKTGASIATPETSYWELARKIANSLTVRTGERASIGNIIFSLAPAEPIVIDGGMLPYEQLRTALRDSVVELRGWYFPHAPENELKSSQDTETGLSYIQLQTDWQDCVESMSLFANGYFQYERLLREDLRSRVKWPTAELPISEAYLDWLQLVYTIGEFLLFATRLYDAFGYRGELEFEIRLNGMKDRLLDTVIPGRDIGIYQYRCMQPEVVVKKRVDITVLRADLTSEAVSTILRIFALFHWERVSVPMLTGDLDKLFARRL